MLPHAAPGRRLPAVADLHPHAVQTTARSAGTTNASLMQRGSVGPHAQCRETARPVASGDECNRSAHQSPVLFQTRQPDDGISWTQELKSASSHPLASSVKDNVTTLHYKLLTTLPSGHTGNDPLRWIDSAARSGGCLLSLTSNTPSSGQTSCATLPSSSTCVVTVSRMD